MSVLRGKGFGGIRPREHETEAFIMWMMAGMTAGMLITGLVFALVKFIIGWRRKKRGDLEEAQQEKFVTHFQEDKLKCKQGIFKEKNDNNLKESYLRS